MTTLGAVGVPTPIGMGTRFAESLTSYVRRIGAHLLVPAPRVLGGITGLRSASRLSDAVNGTERVSAHIVSSLTEWSDILEIGMLTFEPFSSGLHLRKEFRDARAWCPLCLAAPKAVAYDRLAWAFALSERCLHDGAVLRETCGGCGKRHRPLDLWAHPDKCAHCGTPLADRSAPVGEIDSTSAAVGAVIEWVQRGRQVEPSRIAAWLRNLRGSAPAVSLATSLGLTPSTAANVDRGEQRLQMRTLVSLLVHGKATMELLHALPPAEVVSERRPVRRGLLVDPKALDREVRRELKLPLRERRSVRQLAKDLGISHITLRRRSKLTDVLVRDWKAARFSRR